MDNFNSGPQESSRLGTVNSCEEPEAVYRRRERGRHHEHTDLDLHRYRRVRRFFTKVFIRLIWWDILCKLPVLRWFRKPATPRWQKMARQYRDMALEMGGVLIKLGQFLSIRVDILPREVTCELDDLQDEVPAVDKADIIRQIESDFNCPVDRRFQWISDKPLGAASLAQVHQVRTVDDREAVVKVLRPGIEVLVETDLAAIGLALKWLKYYRPISKRMDLDWLIEEFTTVTRRELDLNAEGRSAECLAKDLETITDVYIPEIYWEYTGSKTLTMENVHYIKISDLEAIEKAGIHRPAVADVLHRIYMHQVFETNFVHVDPHPGNVFIRPLPTPEEIDAGITNFAPGQPVPHVPNRPFQIILVDFGMTSRIPERLRTALRECAIAIGTRDAHKYVKSLVSAGSVLEGADLARLEEAHQALFDRMWGVHVGRLRDVAMQGAGSFLHEYRDLLYDTPFQVQVDMLFVMRAIGILSGMAANLDPDFDPWAKTIPWAERFALEELKENQQNLSRDILVMGQSLLKTPGQLDDVLSKTRRGQLTVRMAMSADARKTAHRIEKSIRAVGWMIAGTGFALCSTLLYIHDHGGGYWQMFLVLAGLAFLITLKRD